MTLKARPTTYKGIKMRSRLEARFAAELDAEGGEWAYEPNAFASEKGQYLPDFRLLCGIDKGHYIYIELKPTMESITPDLLERMEIIWESEPNAVLMIHLPPEHGHYFWAAKGKGWFAADNEGHQVKLPVS